MSNFEQILGQLRQFIKKYYLNELFKGLILFIIFTFFYLLITAFVEYFLWLPPQSRRWLFYAQFVITGVFFLIFLAKPLLNLLGLRKDLSTEQAAVIVGKFFPEIKDKLLNALQLHDSSMDSELLFASIEQKAKKLKNFKFSKAVNFKQNLKYLPLLSLPLIIFVILRLTHYDKVIKSSYDRVLSFNQHFEQPLPYRFQILDSLKVIKDNPFELKVKVTGEALPDDLFLVIDNQSLLFNKESDSIFSFHFPSVNDNLSFSVKDDKHHLGNYTLKVINSPLLTSTKIKVIYPSYLNKKPKIFKQNTNLTIPESARIYWDLHTEHTDTILFGINNHIIVLPVKNKKISYDTLAREDFSYQIKPINNFIKNTPETVYHVKVIKDQPPSINVVEKKDTINHQNYYRITASDDYKVSKLQLVYKNQSSGQTKMIPIKVNKSDFIQSVFVFPGNIQLDKGMAYAYFFQAFDNDTFHGFKSVKSETFYFNKLTDKQLKDLLLKQQADQLKNLDALKQKASNQKQNIEKLNQKLSTQRNQDWQSRKQLEQTIQQSQQQEQFFKQTIQKFKDLLKRLPDGKKDDFKKDLQKRLEELEKLKKKQKMLDELKKLAEKLKKEDLIKKLKELENYSEHQEKSLERILELTKKYYLLQKMQKMAEKLKQLSQKQEDLAKQNKDTKNQQDSLNNALDSLQKQADSLQKMNKALKKSMQMPDAKTDMQDIKQDMQNASSKLQQNQSSAANNSQQKAANKMKQLSKSLQMAMQSGGGEQNEEDIKTLQAILKSLLIFSFNEEELLTDLYSHNSKKNLSQQLLTQNNLKVYFNHVNDSLYTLALRNPKISQLILDEAYEIQNSLEKSLLHLAENQSFNAQLTAQYILKSSNTLANFLSNALDNMKNAMPSMGQSQGKKGKGKSFSLPDIIKKQGDALSKAKEGLKPKDGKGKKKGKKGQSNSGNKKGKENKGEEGEAKRQYELYKMQQRVKEDLNQLGDKFSDKATKKRIKDLSKKMEQLQNRILKEGITESIVQKMIALQHELLKLKNATFQQHEDNKRQSRTNFNRFNGLDSTFLYENFKFLPQNELLKRIQIPVNQDVKNKIMQYLNE